MKTRKQTDRRYHIRRVASGAVPVRKHLMHYWVVKVKPRGMSERYIYERGGMKPAIFTSQEGALVQAQTSESNFKKAVLAGIIDKRDIPQYRVVRLKDSDGDGAPDVVDCEPHNPKKQDKERYSYDWVGYGLILKDTESGKDVLIQGEDGSKLYDELEKLWNKKKWKKSGASKEQINDSIISEYFEVR